MPGTLEAVIADKLRLALAPVALRLHDDSAKHKGHAGNRGGAHFDVRIVSAQFAGLNLVARHKLVYRALAEEMKSEIHALSIEALTPEEAAD